MPARGEGGGRCVCALPDVYWARYPGVPLLCGDWALYAGTSPRLGPVPVCSVRWLPLGGREGGCPFLLRSRPVSTHTRNSVPTRSWNGRPDDNTQAAANSGSAQAPRRCRHPNTRRARARGEGPARLFCSPFLPAGGALGVLQAIAAAAASERQGEVEGASWGTSGSGSRGLSRCRQHVRGERVDRRRRRRGAVSCRAGPDPPPGGFTGQSFPFFPPASPWGRVEGYACLLPCNRSPAWAA